MAFLVGQGAKGYGTRDVCCARSVLSTAIEQEETVRLERSVALLVRLVMDDCTVSAISCNSGKTRLLKARLFSPEGGELTVNVHFRNRRPCLHLFVQPTQEAYHGYTVVEHSLTEAFHFGLVAQARQRGTGFSNVR